MQRTLLLAACLMASGALSARVRTVVGQVPADTMILSLAEAQRLALSDNPAYRAEQQAVAIARGQQRQARTYAFNPQLTFDAPGLTTNGAFGRYEASLSQEIEWAGQWLVRSRAGRLGLERSEFEVQNATRQTLGDVTIAFLETLAAQRRLEVVREVLALNDQLLSATRIQAAEGEISQLEANLVEIEHARARARVLGAEREVGGARLELQRITAIGLDRVVRVVDETPESPLAPVLELDSIILIALARRPDLQAQDRAIAQADALVSLARREALPNVQVGALAEREEAGGGSRIGIGVSLSVPLWNRNQGLIDERQAESDQFSLEQRAGELALRTQVTDAYLAYRAASDEAQIYETNVLGPAHTNQSLLETAFLAGKIGLPTLVLLRNQLFDAELGYWDAWLAARRSLVQLHSATATLDAPESLQLSRNQ